MRYRDWPSSVRTMDGRSRDQMEHSVGKDQCKNELSSHENCQELLCKIVSSLSLEEFQQRFSNHSALGML